MSLKCDLSHSALWRQTPETLREELWFTCKTAIVNGRGLNYCWNHCNVCSFLAGLSMKSIAAAKAKIIQTNFWFTCLFNLPYIVYLMFFKGRRPWKNLVCLPMDSLLNYLRKNGNWNKGWIKCAVSRTFLGLWSLFEELKVSNTAKRSVWTSHWRNFSQCTGK